MAYGALKHSRRKIRKASWKNPRTIKIEVKVSREPGLLNFGPKGGKSGGGYYVARACVGSAQRGGYARKPHEFAGKRRCVWEVKGSSPTKAARRAVQQLLKKFR